MLDFREIVSFPIQVKTIDLIALNLTKKRDVTEADIKAHPVKISAKSWSKIMSLNSGEMFLDFNISMESDQTQFFEINIIYKGLCISESKVSENELKLFIEYQSLKMIWPYLRESVVDLMVRMGLKPIILPTIDLVATSAKAEEKENKGHNQCAGSN